MIWTEDNIERLRKLAGAGASMAMAAEKLGTTRNAVAGVSHRHGITWECPKERHRQRTSDGGKLAWSRDDGTRRQGQSARARLHFADRWAALRRPA